eukprot:4304225-Prymnesium_polylepis.1
MARGIPRQGGSLCIKGRGSRRLHAGAHAELHRRGHHLQRTPQRAELRVDLSQVAVVPHLLDDLHAARERGADAPHDEEGEHNDDRRDAAVSRIALLIAAALLRAELVLLVVVLSRVHDSGLAVNGHSRASVSEKGGCLRR